MKDKKMVWNSGIFLIVMAFTFRSVFRGQNVGEIVGYIGKMSFSSVVTAIILAIAFVLVEGSMICYLLKELGEKTTLFHCAGYSFVGFFFSGLTPSATGGQPMQLYYMKKDGIGLASSSVVLMTVAVLYKFVLVLVGTGILLKTEKILVLMKVLKPSENRQNKIEQFLKRYHETVQFFKYHKKIIGITMVGTLLQRSCIFVLTYVVYIGIGLKNTEALTIVLLQAAICIAVDMLPLPGAQGITETMYRAVFKNIFPGQYLIASVCIIRGISFYLVMAISFVVWSIALLSERGGQGA